MFSWLSMLSCTSIAIHLSSQVICNRPAIENSRDLLQTTHLFLFCGVVVVSPKLALLSYVHASFLRAGSRSCASLNCRRVQISEVSGNPQTNSTRNDNSGFYGRSVTDHLRTSSYPHGYLCFQARLALGLPSVSQVASGPFRKQLTPTLIT